MENLSWYTEVHVTKMEYISKVVKTKSFMLILGFQDGSRLMLILLHLQGQSEMSE
jgi:hypothetical protein